MHAAPDAAEVLALADAVAKPLPLRWGLSADQAKVDALTVYAEACETTVVPYTPAP